MTGEGVHSSDRDTYSLLLYREGTFTRMLTGMRRGEALDEGMQAIRDGEASRFEVWNEYHDTLTYSG